METGLAPRLWRYRAEWIPAYAGMTVHGGGMTWTREGVGSRFRGNDGGGRGIRGDGACAPSVALGAEWIPAYAGMTVGGNDGAGAGS